MLDGLPGKLSAVLVRYFRTLKVNTAALWRPSNFKAVLRKQAPMSEIILDRENFKARLSSIRKSIPCPLFAILGKSEDVEISNMNSAVFLYLLKYELPETILVISAEEVLAVTSQKKALILGQLGGEVRISVRNKDNTNLEELKSQIKRVGGDLGVVDRENIKGSFSELFMQGLSFKDITAEVLDLFQVKDTKETRMSEIAGKNAKVFMQHCINLVIEEQAESRRITHGDLSQKIEDVLYEDGDVLHGDQNKLEFTFPPFLQSGNIFDLENLHFNSVEGTYVKYENVLCKIGIRYEGYCAEIGRTVLFNPEQDIVDDLNTLYRMQKEILGYINPGVSVASALKKVKNLANERGVGERINEDVVYSTGLYHKERLVKDKFESGMVLVVNLELKNGAKFLNLTDTFILSDVMVCITEGLVDEQAKKDAVPKGSYEVKPGQAIIIRTDKKTIGIRVRKRDQDLEKSIRRAEHQKELLDKLIEVMKAHYREAKVGEKKSVEEEKVYIPYKKESLVIRKPRITVDKKSEAVIIPIFGYCVPFHISMIKNMSKTEEGGACLLRINFDPKETLKGTESTKNLDSLKSVSYCGSPGFIDEVFEQITGLKKVFQEKINLKIQKVGVVEQEALEEVKGRKVVLTDVLLRTDARTGTKKAGAANLELHKNGFRFGSQEIDLLFSNIKNIFFQEATIEQRAILHFHLVSPLIIGKKTFNVQVFKDVGMNMTHDTLRNKNDEYMEMILDKEFEEKKNMINKEFRLFIEHIEESYPIKVEVPYVDKSFYGVPFRESVLIHPTNESLVSLVETPFLVISLSDIEIVNFERVVYGVKTSDMIIVFKDKGKSPVSILSIDTSCISDLKDFFDSKNVVFLETRVNIQWPNLIKTIMVDPLSFYENNAWYDLINPEVEDDSESVTEVETEYTSTENEFNTDEESSDMSEDFEGEEEVSEGEEEYYGSEEGDESFSDASEDYDYAKKRKK